MEGALTIGFGLLFTFVALARLDLELKPQWFWLLALGAPAPVFIGLGTMYWHRARRDDEVHDRFQKTPSLSLRLVRDHDDAWIEGAMRCPQPMRPPEFARACSWFHLVVEEKRGSGKNEHWAKVSESRHGTSIWITDTPREIEVDLRRATVDYPAAATRRQGNRRYRLRYLPVRGQISACGLVRYRREVLGEHEATARDAALEAWVEKHRDLQEREQASVTNLNRQERLAAAGRAIRARKRSRRLRRPPPHDAWHLQSLDDAHGVPEHKRLMLTGDRALPLLVTPLRRPEWHDRSEADELASKTRADVLLAYGIPAAVWALGVWRAWWALAFLPGAAIGILVMLAVVLPSRIVRLHNRFVMYRQRIPRAEADIAVDEKMRHDLVPQLIAVVAAYATHERGVQKRLAELRRRGFDQAAVLALREAHPDLAAQANFALLADDLTALEEKIAFGRALLRDSITEYNSLVQRFPNNLLAAVTGFRSEPLPTA